jgi:hypothetical protein
LQKALDSLPADSKLPFEARSIAAFKRAQGKK